MPSFDPPKYLVSDKESYFSAGCLKELINVNFTELKTVKEYAPMSNGRAERMAATIKGALKKTELASADAWDDLLPWTVYAYHRHRMSLVSVSLFKL